MKMAQRLCLATIFLAGAHYLSDKNELAQAATAPTWVSAAAGSRSDSGRGRAVRTNRFGDSCSTGYVSKFSDFFPCFAKGGKDILIVGPTWDAFSGGPGDDVGNDVAFDDSGNIYVAGWFTGSAAFAGPLCDCESGIDCIGSRFGSGVAVTGVGKTVFLAKYSGQGDVLWVQTGKALGDNEGLGVAVDPGTGMVYLTGKGRGATTFSSANGSLHSVPGPNTWYMFLVKYDGNGNFQWGEWNQASLNSVGEKVALDTAGNPYVTGWFEGSTTFRSKDGHNLTLTGLSSPVQVAPDYPKDAFIVKYDSNGNAKWVNQLGGYKAEGIDIAASSDGKISITGFIGNINSGTPAQAVTIATSQPGGTNINLGGGSYTKPYNKDVFVATYNTAGVLLKASRYGGKGDDGGSGIAYDKGNNLYVDGVFEGTINIDGHVLTGAKPLNLFVVKYAAAGGVAWTKKADGPGTDDFESNPRMTVSSTGTVQVTGGFTGTAIFDTFTIQSPGMENVFNATLCVGKCLTPPFQFTKVKTPAGFNVHALNVASINNNGSMAATAYGNSDGLLRSFILNPSGAWPIAVAVPGASSTIAHHINNKAEVTGTGLFTSFLPRRGFKKAGTSNTYGVFYVPTQPTEGSATNDNGLQVGFFYDSANHAHGFTRDSKGYHPRDWFDVTDTFVLGVNTFNQLVGFGTDAQSIAHGFEFYPGFDDGTGFFLGSIFASIDHPAGSLGTRVTGINARGDSVGWYIDANGRHHGFVYRNSWNGFRGQFTTLDFPGSSLTEVNGISDSGQIVGRYVIGVSPSAPGYETGSFVASP
jgi:hypothetical protein